MLSIWRGGGVTAGTQADAPQFDMGARFGETAMDSMHEGQARSIRLGDFCWVASKDYTFTFSLPKIVIKVAHLTAEAFLLTGFVSSKNIRERHVVAE